MSIEHNYYQLMGIEWFSDINLIQKKYKQLAKIYHPDKNPSDPNVGEYFKIVTQGYNLLSNASQKNQYDQILKEFYNKDTEFVNQQNAKVQLKEKIKANNERKKSRIIQQYLKAENDFPHKYRLIFAILIFLSGFLMTYNNWFINFKSYNVLYALTGFIIFGLGCFLIANNYFKKEQFASYISVGREPETIKSVKTFVWLFLTTPIFFFALVTTTKYIHMKHYFDYTIVNQIAIDREQVAYSYVINGEEILRKTDFILGKNYHDKSKLRVKFSKINPNISELVFESY
ncbi:MAG: J domain-containing protein [Bacteroidota bacterium]|nr:J domain-containing protein [Bacteroidota bacterium]